MPGPPRRARTEDTGRFGRRKSDSRPAAAKRSVGGKILSRK
jgi:hypothetical protein